MEVVHENEQQHSNAGSVLLALWHVSYPASYYHQVIRVNTCVQILVLNFPYINLIFSMPFAL